MKHPAAAPRRAGTSPTPNRILVALRLVKRRIDRDHRHVRGAALVHHPRGRCWCARQIAGQRGSWVWLAFGSCEAPVTGRG